MARTLEAEWNECLLEPERIGKENEQAREKPPLALTAAQREQILGLPKDLPRLFRSPTTRVSQKKEVLRLLVHDITLVNEDDPWSIDVSIRWRTGVGSRHRAERPKLCPMETFPDAVKRIEELYRTTMDKDIARTLDAEGHRSGTGLPFTAQLVSHLRQRHGWMKRRRRGPTR